VVKARAVLCSEGLLSLAEHAASVLAQANHPVIAERRITVSPLRSFLMFLPSLFYSIGRGPRPAGLRPLVPKGTRPRPSIPLAPCLVILVALTPAWARSASVEPEGFTGKVSGVESGHVLIVQEGDKTHRVHLYGILSPSKGAPQAGKARGVLEELAFGKLAQVVPVPPRDPKRIYAMVRLGETNLNEEMLRRGLAWVNPKACALPVCEKWRALQEEARAGSLGLWSDPSGAPPWERGARKKPPGKQK
jgi:micrococcal nuclease